MIDERRAKGDELQSDDEGSVSRKESTLKFWIWIVFPVSQAEERWCSTAEARMVKEGEREREREGAARRR